MRYIKSLFWIILASVIAFYIGRFWGNKTVSHPPPVVIHDTVPTIRVDTVVRFLEKVNWRKVAPETVVVYRERIRIDTVYGMEPELMISLYRIGEMLKVQAIRSDSVREYIYRLSPFTSEWSIMSKGRGFFRTGEANMDNGQTITRRDCLGKDDLPSDIIRIGYQATGITELFNVRKHVNWYILEVVS